MQSTAAACAGAGRRVNASTFWGSTALLVLVVPLACGRALSFWPIPKLHSQLQQARRNSSVWMSDLEMSTIEAYLDPSLSMLEWGSGSSTSWFSQFVMEYYSVEHDSEWYKKVSMQAAKLPRVHAILSSVPAGTLGWAGGFEEGTYLQFHDYVQAPSDFQVETFDRVLIDGRARAACATYILRHLTPDSVVFIHDYVTRTGYHSVVEQHYTPAVMIAEGQSLMVARPNAESIAQAKAGLIGP